MKVTKSIFSLILVVSFLGTAGAALAQDLLPQLVEGSIAVADGAPVADGIHTVTVAIAGVEAAFSVEVETFDGRFSTLIEAPASFIATSVSVDGTTEYRTAITPMVVNSTAASGYRDFQAMTDEVSVNAVGSPISIFSSSASYRTEDMDNTVTPQDEQLAHDAGTASVVAVH